MGGVRDILDSNARGFVHDGCAHRYLACEFTDEGGTGEIFLIGDVLEPGCRLRLRLPAWEYSNHGDSSSSDQDASSRHFRFDRVCHVISDFSAGFVGRGLIPMPLNSSCGAA
jgi:hypothetical protein